MNGRPSIQQLPGPRLTFSLVVGAWEPHQVEVSYSRTLRVLRIEVNGRLAYRHCGLMPWAERKAREFKTPGRDSHTFVVEPPGAPANHAPDTYMIWLDGQPLLRVER